MAEAAELEAELDKLKGERSALVDPSAVTGPTPSSTGLMLQDAKAPSPTDAKKQEVLAGAYQDAPAPQKWDGLMFALGSELGIADDLLSELPLSDLNRPMPISESVFGFNLEIQATQRYVMKALHETNLRKFNKLTPKQLQIFNEAIELSVPSIRDLGQAGEMEDMVRLFGLLGLELPVRPKNETMQRKLTLAEIKNNTGVRFSLLRMLRTNSAGRAATMIRAARAQAAQSSAKRKLDKANAVLDIPQD